MPAKKRKNVISDAERAKRLRETAEAIGTSNSLKHFEYSFKRVVTGKDPSRKAASR